MDNLSVHRSKDAKKAYEDEDVFPIYNAPYSPDYNPIEFIFAKVKNHYRRTKIHTECANAP